MSVHAESLLGAFNNTRVFANATAPPPRFLNEKAEEMPLLNQYHATGRNA
jgi:hypothetical protein